MQILTGVVFPAIATVLAGLSSWWYVKKAKMYIYCSNIACVIVYPREGAKYGPILHLTHSVTLVNGGRVPLKKVQLLHNFDVRHDKNSEKGNANLIAIGVSPDIQYSFEDEGKTMIFPYIAPKENITLIYIYPPQNTEGLSVNFRTIHKFNFLGVPIVRSEEAIGEKMNIVKSLGIPTWFNVFLLFLVVVGFWNSSSFISHLFFLVNDNSFCV